MVFVEVPDAVAYTKRQCYHKAKQLPTNCFYIVLCCLVHRLHRITTLALREDELVGDCHAKALISNNLHHKPLMRKSARAIVDRDLIVIHGSSPAQEHLDHIDRVIYHTRLRREGIVRGRLVSGEGAPAVKKSVFDSDAPRNLKRMLPGDIRQEKFVHYEDSCCIDKNGHFQRDICVDNVTAAIISAGLLCDHLTDVPSKDRWGSLSEHESE